MYVQLEVRKETKASSVNQFSVARMTSTKEFRSCCYMMNCKKVLDLFENSMNALSYKKTFMYTTRLILSWLLITIPSLM